MSEPFDIRKHLEAARAKALEAKRARREGAAYDLQAEMAPAVLVALAARIGEEEAAGLSPHEAAMQLAQLAPADYLSISKNTREAAQAAMIAARYALAPDTPEAQAAREKFEADCELARRDYPAYKAIRDKEAQERIALERAERTGSR